MGARLFGGNVGLTFAYRICDGLATGIWSSAVLSTYVSVLMGSDDVANEVGTLATPAMTTQMEAFLNTEETLERYTGVLL